MDQPVVKSAGLFVVDCDDNVCLILRKFPYDEPDLRITTKISADNNCVLINVFTPFLEMIQIPRGSCEPIDGSDKMATAIREFREETKCKNTKITVYNSTIELSWMDCGTEWKYIIYVGKLSSRLKFDIKKHDIRPCVINISKSNEKYKCFIDAKTLGNMRKETVLIMNINEYYRFMINEQLGNYKEYAPGYRDCLNTIMRLSYRKPSGITIR